jgi:hypothetical protein
MRAKTLAAPARERCEHLNVGLGVVSNGRHTSGWCDRAIIPAEAEVIRRIFRHYSAGMSPKAIAKRLNAELCPGPAGAPWKSQHGELNRLRRSTAPLCRTVARSSRAVDREIRKFIQAIKDGVSGLSIKDEFLSLEARKVELQSRIEAPAMPELLHPRMSDVYRKKVGSFCLALESEESRTGARDAIRALIEVIMLEPDGITIFARTCLHAVLTRQQDNQKVMRSPP